MMNIQTVKWTGPERDTVRVVYRDHVGREQACYVPVDDRNGDWRAVQAWQAGGGVIEDPEE